MRRRASSGRRLVAFLVAFSGAAQAQGMRQLVEPGQGLPHDLGMLRLAVDTLPDRLPGHVLPRFIVGAALDSSAALAFPPGGEGFDVEGFPHDPLVSEKTTHVSVPFDTSMQWAGASLAHGRSICRD